MRMIMHAYSVGLVQQLVLVFLFILEKLILDDPVFSLEDYQFLSTEEAFSRSMEKSAHYIKILREMENIAKLDGHYMDE